MDEFWFDRKLGFCEHFAASMVVVLRALDVPARIVTGYQGADPDPVDGYYIVRQSNAHAWVEYWQAGEGWVRVDPTASVSPERIERGTGLVPRQGLVAGAIGSVSPQLLVRLRNLLEAVDNRWNQWVMNYSRGQQFRLLESLGVDAPSWHDLAYALIALLCGGSLAAAGWALWDRHRQDPWQRLQQRVQQRLAQLQVPVQPHDPPRTRARRVRERLGAAGEALAQELEALDRSRYAQADAPASIAAGGALRRRGGAPATDNRPMTLTLGPLLLALAAALALPDAAQARAAKPPRRPRKTAPRATRRGRTCSTSPPSWPNAINGRWPGCRRSWRRRGARAPRSG